MKNSVIGILILVALVVGGAYFYLSGKEYEVRVSEAEIQEKLAQKLPLTKSYLILFQVTLDNPRIELINGSNRINGGLDVKLNIKLTGETKELGGSLDLSGGVKYLAETGEFFLTNPIIENLAVDGIPKLHEKTAVKALTQALGNFYNRYPIYSLSNQSAKEAVVKMILKNIVIMEKEVVITLGI